MTSSRKLILLRYPGGKQRQLPSFFQYLPTRKDITGLYIEPFVGGGAVFFCIGPESALLADINKELIDLYKGIKSCPIDVWNMYASFSSTREEYYRIRDMNTADRSLAERAARILYLNRTCFKGMWRHNANGQFNVGYGGQDRRWAISKQDLLAVAKRLEAATLRCCDFVEVVDSSREGDFIFLDPPYKPGERQLIHKHYQYGNFGFSDQQRLADALERASTRGVLWAMTNSCHPEIISLYSKYKITPLPKGTGQQIGHITDSSDEILVRNYEESW